MENNFNNPALVKTMERQSMEDYQREQLKKIYNYKSVKLLNGDYYKKRYGLNIDGDFYVEYRPLTANDEEFIGNANDENPLFETIIERCVLFPKGFSLKQITFADKIYLFWLLRLTVDTKVKLNLKDPKTGEPFTTTVDLSKVTINEPTKEYLPNSEGKFSIKLKAPKDVNLSTGKMPDYLNIEFHLLNLGEMDLVSMQTEEEKKKPLALQDSHNIISLLHSIDNIEGVNRDDYPLVIKTLHIKEKHKIIEFLDKAVMKINNKFEVEAPSGSRFQTFVNIFSPEFIWPS